MRNYKVFSAMMLSLIMALTYILTNTPAKIGWGGS